MFESLSSVSFLGFDLAVKNVHVLSVGMVGNVDLHCCYMKVDVELWVQLFDAQSLKLINRLFQTPPPLPLYNVDFCTAHIVLLMFTTTLL